MQISKIQMFGNKFLFNIALPGRGALYRAPLPGFNQVFLCCPNIFQRLAHFYFYPECNIFYFSAHRANIVARPNDSQIHADKDRIAIYFSRPSRHNVYFEGVVEKGKFCRN